MSRIIEATNHVQDEAVRLIVRDLFFDLDDRRGFALDQVGQEELQKWAMKWGDMVAGLDLRRAQIAPPMRRSRDDKT